MKNLNLILYSMGKWNVSTSKNKINFRIMIHKYMYVLFVQVIELIKYKRKLLIYNQ